MEKLLRLFEALNANEKTILETASGSVYKRVSQVQSKNGFEERTTESRLQLELYGEYPLSRGNEEHYQEHIRPLFSKF